MCVFHRAGSPRKHRVAAQRRGGAVVDIAAVFDLLGVIGLFFAFVAGYSKGGQR